MAGEETIGDWTISQLVRFLQENQRQNPPEQSPNFMSDTVTVNSLLKIIDQIQFGLAAQLTVGAAGGASALPATPSGYIQILDYTGNPFVVPYYKAS